MSNDSSSTFSFDSDSKFRTYEGPSLVPDSLHQGTYPVSESSASDFHFESKQQSPTRPSYEEPQVPYPVPQFNIEKVDTTLDPAMQTSSGTVQNHANSSFSPPYTTSQVEHSANARPLSQSHNSYLDNRRLTTVSRNSVSSMGSAISSVNTLYSAGDFDTDIEINQAVAQVQILSKPHEGPSLVAVTSPAVESAGASASATTTEDRKRERLKQLFKSSKTKTVEPPHHDVEQAFFNDCTNTLNEKVYSGSTKGTLNLDYDLIMETYLFGASIDQAFSLENLSRMERNDILMAYLSNSQLESGVVNFSLCLMPFRGHVSDNELYQLFSLILSQLDDFNDILNQYKVQLDQNKKTTKFNSKETFDKLEHFANREGFTLPMAQSIFGIWLLTYAKGGLDSSYKDDRIMNQFRRSARMSLVLRKLVAADFFKNVLEIGDQNGNKFNNYEKIALERFLHKDNDFALSMAIFSIGEFYQFVQCYDTAVNYWESNGHITRDVESCNLAIWGLGDGFGGGNKVKTLEKLGKGSKRNKYNTKRRIAHLTRISSKNGGTAEFGTSWVWKEKYD